MNNTIILTKEATLNNALGTHTNGNDKPVWCITTRKYFARGVDAAETYGLCKSGISNVCNGKQKTCGGMEFCFVADRDQHLDKLITPINHTDEEYDSLTKELEALKKENEELKADASLGRAIKAELEKERKAKAELEAKKQKANERLAKASKKVATRQSIVARKGKEYEDAIALLTEAEREKGEIELEILKLEGKVK